MIIIPLKVAWSLGQKAISDSDSLQGLWKNYVGVGGAAGIQFILEVQICHFQLKAFLF